MSAQTIERDERTIAVENAGYRWSYLLLAFGVLGLAAFRSFALHQSTLDLIVMVVMSGVLSSAYQVSPNAQLRRPVRRDEKQENSA